MEWNFNHVILHFWLWVFFIIIFRFLLWRSHFIFQFFLLPEAHKSFCQEPFYGWCVDVLMCWCADVLMCWCVDVLMCWCADVLMCWCVDVLMCWCADVLMCWHRCVDVMLMCWCVDIDVLMCDVMCWCVVLLCCSVFRRREKMTIWFFSTFWYCYFFPTKNLPTWNVNLHMVILFSSAEICVLVKCHWHLILSTFHCAKVKVSKSNIVLFSSRFASLTFERVFWWKTKILRSFSVDLKNSLFSHDLKITYFS